MTKPPDILIRRFLAGLPSLATLLEHAGPAAVSTRDRQTVAVVAAHLAGDRVRAVALAREHLADHPGNDLVTVLLKENS